VTIYVTHGSKKNVGDYLIHDRGRALIERVLPSAFVRSIPRWNRDALPSDAGHLVLCGGPGISSRMLEDTFPIAERALATGVPLSGIALGWSGVPARDPGAFQLSERSIEAFRSIESTGEPLTVRDDLTLEILASAGIGAIRTGCTAWYSLPDLKKPIGRFRRPQTIVFTTPARPQNTLESTAIMRRLKARYPRARLIASFHRGVLPDKETGFARSATLVAQALVAKMLGFEVLDAAYDLSKIDFYRHADLHIGYRVHAHLSFVSQHRPSILLCEDGRGHGQATTLNGEESVLWAGEEGLVDRVDAILSEEEHNGWQSLHQAVDVIESSYPFMEAAVRRLGKAIA